MTVQFENDRAATSSVPTMDGDAKSCTACAVQSVEASVPIFTALLSVTSQSGLSDSSDLKGQ